MPDLTSLPPGAAPRRDRVVRLTLAASVGAKIISVACTLAQVPLALHALGAEAYGLWITLMSVLVMLNFVDFGLGVGMQKAMATAFGADDLPRLRQTFNSGALALTGLALVALAIGVPLALFFDWGALLKIRDAALQPLAGPALAITVAAFALSLPFNAVPRLAMATQRGWLQAVWIAVFSFASLAIVAYAASARWGFLPFLTLTAMLPAAQGLAFWRQLRRALGWSRWDFSLLPRAEWRALAGDSLLFAVPQVGLAFVQAAPPLALSLAAGPLAATAFNLLQRLFSPVTQGQLMFLTPLWPAVTEAHVRGDTVWVHRALRQSLLVALGCLVALVLLTWQSGVLLRWWVGDSTTPPTSSLAWLTCGWFAAQVVWQPFMYLLVAVGRLRVLAAWSLVGVVLCLTGIVSSLAFHTGASGVLAAAVVGLAMGGLPGLATATRNALPSPIVPCPGPSA